MELSGVLQLVCQPDHLQQNVQGVPRRVHGGVRLSRSTRSFQLDAGGCRWRSPCQPRHTADISSHGWRQTSVIATLAPPLPTWRRRPRLRASCRSRPRTPSTCRTRYWAPAQHYRSTRLPCQIRWSFRQLHRHFELWMMTDHTPTWPGFLNQKSSWLELIDAENRWLQCTLCPKKEATWRLIISLANVEWTDFRNSFTNWFVRIFFMYTVHTQRPPPYLRYVATVWKSKIQKCYWFWQLPQQTVDMFLRTLWGLD